MKKRITVIESDEDTNVLLSHFLANAGYDVAYFADETVVKNTDDLISDLFIVDHSLPGINSVSLTAHLKNRGNTRHVPILVLSGNPAVSRKVIKAGASAFLEKPFELNHLLKTIDHLLSGSVHHDVESNRDDSTKVKRDVNKRQ